MPAAPGGRRMIRPLEKRHLGDIVRLYFHPVSTTSRPVMLFAAEHGQDLDLKVVDLFTGEHKQDANAAVNPSQQVPVLEDGDFRLTESSAILKYLADACNASSYPRDPKARARVNERMDWLNTGFYRSYGYDFVYPQLLPDHKRADPAVQAATVEWGREKSRRWLSILDRDLIGADKDYLCGAEPTIADFLGVSYVTLGEVVRVDLSPYPNVRAWLARMKALPSWAPTFAAIDGFGATLQREAMQAV